MTKIWSQNDSKKPYKQASRRRRPLINRRTQQTRPSELSANQIQIAIVIAAERVRYVIFPIFRITITQMLL